MPVTPVKIRKRFIALRNCQIGTGFSFLTLLQGVAYETDFKSVDAYNSLVGMKMIVENRGNKIKTDVEKAEEQSRIELNSPVHVSETDPKIVQDLVNRISKARTVKALNTIISKASPMELNSASVQNAIVSIQSFIQKNSKELV
jgi:hypothetical protein